MKALELADAYADSVAEHRLESLYGTSKSYTLEKAKERDEAHEALAAELRRLAEVEAERDALKADYERACKLVADMHMAAMGGVVGPVLGVVEDVAALKAELERIKALPPVAWCLGNPELSDSSNLFLAHEFAPDGEHEDEWTALYALGSKHE